MNLGQLKKCVRGLADRVTAIEEAGGGGGSGINWMGEWDDASVAYTAGDAVFYDDPDDSNGGNTYYAIADNVSDSLSPPPGNADWVLMVQGGENGQNSGFSYEFDTKTSSADPTAGRLNVNNVTLSSATRLYISETTSLGVSIAAYIATWDDSTNTVRGQFKMYSADNPAIFAIYNVTGSVTDNGAWNTLVIAHVVSSGTFTNSMPIKVEFYRAGDVGATGATGGATIQSFQTLTDGATVTWTADGSVAENNAVVTLAGNRTLAMSGWTSGMKGVLRVIQDGTGGRTLTLPATSTVPDGGGGVISLSTAGNAVDLVYVICHGTNLFHFILLPNLT